MICILIFIPCKTPGIGRISVLPHKAHKLCAFLLAWPIQINMISILIFLFFSSRSQIWTSLFGNCWCRCSQNDCGPGRRGCEVQQRSPEDKIIDMTDEFWKAAFYIKGRLWLIHLWGIAPAAPSPIPFGACSYSPATCEINSSTNIIGVLICSQRAARPFSPLIAQNSSW
jgi:hypothetical protein